LRVESAGTADETVLAVVIVGAEELLRVES
jgi:hypothetical protein